MANMDGILRWGAGRSEIYKSCACYTIQSNPHCLVHIELVYDNEEFKIDIQRPSTCPPCKGSVSRGERYVPFSLKLEISIQQVCCAPAVPDVRRFGPCV